MTGPILVAYASRYGTTREVAEAIATTLREHHLAVELGPAAEVESVDAYSAIVLGGGIYMGRWHRDARGFVRHYQDELKELPVAIFALGPVTEKPEDYTAAERQFQRSLGRLPVEPFAVRVFGGAVDPAKLPFPFKHMPVADVRNWDAIRGWAVEVADRFVQAPALA